MDTNLHIAWARLFFHALAAAGIADVVVSPGSRSTPLTIAACSTVSIRTTAIIDERSAAFYALGQARVTARPTVLVCTSGTAPAHYFPAVIEAAHAGIPLLVVTADRPWELHDVGSQQTIDQAKLFGGFVRHYAELGLPDPSPAALRAVPRIAAQSVSRTLFPVRGPVHINARFRKPLEPTQVSEPEAWEPIVSALMRESPPSVHPPSADPDAAAVVSAQQHLARASRGLIVCGPAPVAAGDAREAVFELARRTGFVLLPEATSQMRFGCVPSGVAVCSAFDQVLRCSAFAKAHRPDLILELGAAPTSSAYAEFLALHAGVPRIVVTASSWSDPRSDASLFVFGEPAAFVRSVLRDLRPAPTTPEWAMDFARADQRALSISSRLVEEGPLSEGAIAKRLLVACPEGTNLLVGNSTPVRDLDAFCPMSPRGIGVLHQRGCAGIDGLIAGAAGSASVCSGPTALLLGDVSFCHDIGSLAVAAKAADQPLVIVVVDNGGGRIFDHLPIARAWDNASFERFFATPPTIDIGQVASAFGIPIARAGNYADLRAALDVAFARSGPTVVHAMASPRRGAELAARIQREVDAELSTVFA